MQSLIWACVVSKWVLPVVGLIYRVGGGRSMVVVVVVMEGGGG